MSLSVKNISKTFATYHSEWYRILKWLGVNVQPATEHKVLDNISFSVEPGEALAIVGANGAGKSTLLKIITGTLMPSQGSVRLNGKVGAILELGLGFNPELTGHQNAAHAAGLMGYPQSELEELLISIREFAEIGDYFDQPLRIYSSGMQMRLAFALVTAVRPEILIVDEALSVGDQYFQHKSASRIREFQAQGTSLIFVSHDRTAVQSLCKTAILLDNGKIIQEGSPEFVFNYYNALLTDRSEKQIKQELTSTGQTKISSGTGEAKVSSIALFNEKEDDIDSVTVGERVRLVIKVDVYQDIDSLVLGYGIQDKFGQVMYGTNTWHTDQALQNVKSGDSFNFEISFPANLGVGSYSLQTALVDRDTHFTENYEWKDLAFVFEVTNPNEHHFAGCQWHKPEISISHQSIGHSE